MSYETRLGDYRENEIKAALGRLLNSPQAEAEEPDLTMLATFTRGDERPSRKHVETLVSRLPALAQAHTEACSQLRDISDSDWQTYLKATSSMNASPEARERSRIIDGLIRDRNAYPDALSTIRSAEPMVRVLGMTTASWLLEAIGHNIIEINGRTYWPDSVLADRRRLCVSPGEAAGVVYFCDDHSALRLAQGQPAELEDHLALIQDAHAYRHQVFPSAPIQSSGDAIPAAL